MKSRRPRGRKKEAEGRGREGEFFTTPPIDSGKESSSAAAAEMGRARSAAGEGTMREREGEEMRGRQAGAETEGRMPGRREVEVGIGK